ncbi:hypothetical protein CEP54_010891 [Fusarium duplospermum]|uniref:Uncharacterized protein n=1 Tax=Fusarium duplospermum TaxID=1325734 RepID=A0A428PHD3_9HYPO|nr:hypothetical protein CEP54_010891 [Fusarium duplospermum]
MKLSIFLLHGGGMATAVLAGPCSESKPSSGLLAPGSIEVPGYDVTSEAELATGIYASPVSLISEVSTTFRAPSSQISDVSIPINSDSTWPSWLPETSSDPTWLPENTPGSRSKSPRTTSGFTTPPILSSGLPHDIDDSTASSETATGTGNHSRGPKDRTGSDTDTTTNADDTQTGIGTFPNNKGTTIGTDTQTGSDADLSSTANPSVSGVASVVDPNTATDASATGPKAPSVSSDSIDNADGGTPTLVESSASVDASTVTGVQTEATETSPQTGSGLQTSREATDTGIEASTIRDGSTGVDASTDAGPSTSTDTVPTGTEIQTGIDASVTMISETSAGSPPGPGETAPDTDGPGGVGGVTGTDAQASTDPSQSDVSQPEPSSKEDEASTTSQAPTIGEPKGSSIDSNESSSTVIRNGPATATGDWPIQPSSGASGTTRPGSGEPSLSGSPESNGDTASGIDGPQTDALTSPKTVEDTSAPPTASQTSVETTVPDINPSETSKPTNNPSPSEMGTVSQPTSPGLTGTSSAATSNGDTAIDAPTDAPSAAPSGSNDPSTVPPTKDPASPPSAGPDETVTNGPASTTTVIGPITSTVTEPPETFSPTTASNDEWTTNTWITTTSEGDDEPTIVPVLVGCPGCGGKGRGIILWGFSDITGILFNFPGFPKFSFPCTPVLTPGCNIPPKIHEEEEDDDEDDNSTSKEENSTSCTEPITASDCLVSCPTQGPDTEQTPECTTTCTKTHTGCSVTGVTSTTSAEDCSATGEGGSCAICAKQDLDDWIDPDLADENVESLQRRSLEKRGPAAPITNLGWDPQTQRGLCTLAKTGVEFPEYPNGHDIWILEKNNKGMPTNSPEAAVNRWFIMRLDSHCMPQVQKVGYQDFKKTHATSKVKTSDHAFEKSFLKDFFREILDDTAKSVQGVSTGSSQEKINCNDLAYYTDDATGNGPNLLESVFGTFPSRTSHLEDLVGMDIYTNGQAKAIIASSSKISKQVANMVSPGKIVEPTTDWSLAKKWIEYELQFLEKLTIGITIFSHQDVTAAMINQNKRIYDSLRFLDDNAKNCKNDDAVENGIWSFADRYKTYIEDLITGNKWFSINKNVEKAKDDVISHLTASFASLNARQGLTGVQTSELSNWNYRFNKLSKATYSIPAISWGLPKRKRQDQGQGGGEGSACTLPIRSPSSSLSTFSTSVVSSSRQGSTTQTPTTNDSPQTTSTPSSTSTCPRPMGTAVNGQIGNRFDQECICDKEFFNGQPNTPISPELFQEAVSDFCDGSRSMIPTDDENDPRTVREHYPLDDHLDLVLSAQWASPQTDCKPKGEMQLRDFCKNAFGLIGDCKHPVSEGDLVGGRFVDSTDNGCVAFAVFVGKRVKPESTTSPVRSASTEATRATGSPSPTFTCPIEAQALPIITDGDLGDLPKGCLCYPDFMREKEFSKAQYEEAVSDFCDGSRTLRIGSSEEDGGVLEEHYEIGDGNALVLRTTWGGRTREVECEPKKEFELGDYCKSAMELANCPGSEGDTLKGWRYVDSTENGCVVWLAYVRTLEELED